MNTEFVIAIIGIVIVTIDLVVRLRLAPRRRDRFVKALLDSVGRNF